MRKKLKDRRGLTLVEMLCAVVILILLGLILNAGLQLSVRAYDDMTAETETELLLSTAADALTDVLRFAVNPQGNGKFNHTSFGTGVDVKVVDGQILVGGKKLLPPGAYRKGAYVIDEDSLDITYNNGYFTFHLKAKEKNGEIFAEEDFVVKCLNPGGSAGP